MTELETLAESDRGRPIGEAKVVLGVRAGRTRLIHCRARPPLFVQRALYVDEVLPDLAVIHLINPTAGVLAGDRLEIEVLVDTGARARFATQSATKLYAMPEGSASQDTRLAVGDNAYLEYLPDPVIPFRDARFAQATRISVASTGSVIFSDVLGPGRVATGEALAYTQLNSRLTVETAEGRTLYHERTVLSPSRCNLQARGILGREQLIALGTFLVVTDKIAAEMLAEALSSVLVTTSDCRVGIAVAPGGGGVVIKMLARDTFLVQTAFRVAWGIARQAILGVPLPANRKY